MSRRRPYRLLWRYWGVVPLVFLLGGINNRWSLVSYFVAAGVLIAYVVFCAPTYCGAVNRRRGGDGQIEFCRNNSKGLMLGCNLNQHKWQKFRGVFWSGQVKARTIGMFSDPAASLQTLAALVGLVAAGIGVVKWFLVKM